MSQKNQTRKEFELCQNDMIFTKIFKLYQVFLCQNNKIFTKVSELYQVVTCSNTLNLYKNITQQKQVLFLFCYLLACKNSIIF